MKQKSAESDLEKLHCKRNELVIGPFYPLQISYELPTFSKTKNFQKVEKLLCVRRYTKICCYQLS